MGLTLNLVGALSYTHMGLSKPDQTFGHGLLISWRVLPPDYSNSFYKFAGKPLMKLSSNMMNEVITGIPRAD